MKNMTGETIRTYELRDLIGRGGFGVVYRAYQQEVNREVAIKIILPQYANRPYFIRNFKFEAQIIARLEHLHIVPLYDYWRDPQGAYIVMRWLRGGSLLKRLKNGPLPVDTAANMLDQIASALQAAHQNHVVHQDLKAANILLDNADNAFLTDFGIAKDLEGEDDSDPDDPDNIVRGSPEYMSPEQILNTPINPQTDIYSLGILLYEMLTGRTPFQSEDDQEILKNQLYDKLPPLQQFNKELPDALNVVIQRATDKHPKRRYQTPMQMAEGFRMFVDAGKSQATPAPAAVKPEPAQIPDKRSTGMAQKVIDVDEFLRSQQIANPYKGLQAFQENDASNFFGRQKTINQLLDRLREDDSNARFLTVIGPSGIGKSSVVRAGVIPSLRQGALPGSDQWFIADLIPSDQPLARLESALLSVARSSDDRIMQSLTDDENGLHHVLNRILQNDEQLLLVVDQFEELFTLADDQQARRFMSLIVDAIRADNSRLRFIATLRADFYDRPLAYAEFGELVRDRTEIVLPMSKQELHDAIVLPAENVGLELEDGLSEAIIADLKEQPGALPLLQYALSETFSRREGNKLTLNSYRESGGVLGALTRRADELFLPLNGERKQAVRQVFLRLVALGEGTEDTRKRVYRSELQSLGDTELMENVIELYGRYRLLSFDHDSSTRVPTVEIAHEALIRTWERLRQWLDSSRDALRVQRQLAQATRDWMNSNKADGFLAINERLLPFEDLVNNTDILLSDEENAFVKASRVLEQRQRRIRQGFISGIVVLALVASVAAVFAIFSLLQTEEARDDALVARDDAREAEQIALEERDQSRSRELAITAINNRGANLDTALLLALQAVTLRDTFEARNTLFQLLQVNPNLKTFLHGHTDFVRAVDVNRDGTLLASGGQDATVRLWDLESYELVATLEGHRGWVNTVAFSPDGTQLLSGSHDDTIRVWNVETRALIGDPLDMHTDEVWTVTWNAAGTRFASASADQTVRVWDAVTLEQIGEFTAHTEAVFALAFDPTGTLLASGGESGVILLWNTETDEVTELVGHTGVVRSLAFNVAGIILVSGGEDQVLRVWNVRAGQPFGEPLRGHVGEIWSVQFLDDPFTVASSAEDGAVFFWDLNNRDMAVRAIANLELNLTNRPGVVDFSLDVENSLVYWASRENRISVWDLNAGARLATPLIGNALPVVNLEYDSTGENLYLLDNSANVEEVPTTLYTQAEGGVELQGVPLSEDASRLVRTTALSIANNLVATAGADIIIYNADDGSILQALPNAHEDIISALAFAADGDWLFSVDDSGGLVAWRRDDAGVWSNTIMVNAHDGRIWSVGIHPNGNEIATVGEDGLVKRWQFADERASLVEVNEFVHENEVVAVAYSPDGQWLASGDRDSIVFVADLSNADRQRIRLEGHSNIITDLAFSPDSRRLASGSRDQSVRIWEFDVAGSMRPLEDPLVGPSSPVNALIFSPDGTSLTVGYGDQSVFQWQVGLERWQVIACDIANRNLTSTEVDRFLFDGALSPVACIDA